MKRRFFLIPGIAALAIAAGISSYIYSNAPESAAPVAGVQASIAGIKPGMNIAYEIVPAEGKAVSGILQADAQGMAALPSYDAAQEGAPPSMIGYNLEVEKDGKPVRVVMKLDPASGKMSVEGQGLEEFAPITVESGASKIETRADWAGSFRELGTSGLAQPDELNGVEFAFFGNDVMNDSAEEPLVLKVYSAPGGGGPTSTQVNNFSTTYCGSPSMSVCRGTMTSTNNRIVRNYVVALQLMTGQLSAVMMQQMGVIGTFLDAKQQMETQRTLQTLQAEAHKDYQPSDQMCRFGSFVKNITRAEVKGVHDKMALNRILMTSYTNLKNGATTTGYISEMESRLKQFREVYCDPEDNNSGLKIFCQHDYANPAVTAGEDIGGDDPQRFNKDIDYNRTVGSTLTLGTDFTDVTITDDETDVIALAKNLYWPRAFGLAQPPENLAESYEPYLDARHHMALQNVAHNSYNAIVGMKSASRPTATPQQSGPAFMKSLMREFGLPDNEIEALMGANPSYYAQMEVLTKKIYQSPDFYTNLYDKPANIDRIGASMEAIKLMQNRDAYESTLRREMLFSAMVQEAMDKPYRALGDQITSSIKSR